MRGCLSFNLRENNAALRSSIISRIGSSAPRRTEIYRARQREREKEVLRSRINMKYKQPLPARNFRPETSSLYHLIHRMYVYLKVTRKIFQEQWTVSFGRRIAGRRISGEGRWKAGLEKRLRLCRRYLTSSWSSTTSKVTSLSLSLSLFLSVPRDLPDLDSAQGL